MEDKLTERGEESCWQDSILLCDLEQGQEIMLVSAPRPDKDGCRTDVRRMDRRPCLIPAPLPTQALLSKDSVTTASTYECFACEYVCVTHVYSDLRGQKRVSDLPELELQLVVSCRCP